MGNIYSSLIWGFLLNIPQNDFHIYKDKRDFYMGILYNFNSDKTKTLITKIQNAYGQ